MIQQLFSINRTTRWTARNPIMAVCLFSFLVVGCDETNPVRKTAQPSGHKKLLSEQSGHTTSVSARSRLGTPGANAVKPRYVSEPQLENSIVIGLDADMSSGSADSGESIRRGLELAIKEINDSGGLLGRPIELIVRDHRGNPDRGLGNLKEFAKVQNLLGVFGGIHTPVAMRELEFIHENQILYFGPWAAGTPVVENGYSPNYVFRVSVRDEYAGGFLVGKAVEHGFAKIGLLLERTAWGRSNEKAMTSALEQKDMTPVGIEWFNWGEKDVKPQVNRLVESGCELILFVGNPLEGVSMANAVASIPQARRPAVISHWGITGGNFFEQSQESIEKIDLSFLQTFSFIHPKHKDRVASITEAYLRKYDDCDVAEDIYCPVGTAHAYELMQMVARAVKNVGSVDRLHVLGSLENLRDYSGIIRDYQRPFPPHHHDALDETDFILARFDQDGVIAPTSE